MEKNVILELEMEICGWSCSKAVFGHGNLQRGRRLNCSSHSGVSGEEEVVEPRCIVLQN